MTGSPTNKVSPAEPLGKTKANAAVAIARAISCRAVVQVFLTLLTIGSAITAFSFMIVFREHLIVVLDQNFRGQLKNDQGLIQPCVRWTLETCANDKDDQCWDKCCPPGYTCRRNPTVGLYCLDGNVDNQCGDGADDLESNNWCMDYADIPNTCQTPTCLDKQMVFNITVPVFFLAGLAMILDVIDGVMFFASPDAVICKAMINIASMIVKWFAFGLIQGAGTQQFMDNLYMNKCFNREGMVVVVTATVYYVGFIVAEVISALLSLILAPLSAYYGGKIIGVPYVK